MKKATEDRKLIYNFMSATNVSWFYALKYVLAKALTSLILKILHAIFTDTGT